MRGRPSSPQTGCPQQFSAHHPLYLGSTKQTKLYKSIAALCTGLMTTHVRNFMSESDVDGRNGCFKGMSHKMDLAFDDMHGQLFSYRSFLPTGWRIVQILRQRRGKTTNTAPTTLSFSAIQAVRQSTFITEQLYSTCD